MKQGQQGQQQWKKRWCMLWRTQLAFFESHTDNKDRKVRPESVHAARVDAAIYKSARLVGICPAPGRARRERPGRRSRYGAQIARGT
jgi:hypothetical protein